MPDTHLIVLAFMSLASCMAISRADLVAQLAATIAILLAVIDSSLTLPAAISLIVMACMSSLMRSARATTFRKDFLLWAVLLLSFLCEMHWFPGVDRFATATSISFRPDAIPFRFSFNLDKALAAVFVLTSGRIAIWSRRRLVKLVNIVRNSFLLSLAIVALLFVPALASGHVRIDPALHPLFWPWIVHNIFFVVVPEETLFRGLLPERLASILPDTACGRLWVAVVSCCLFGLRHYQGGATLVALSMMAGAGYWFAAKKSKGILGGVVTHTLVNTIHFIFFSYPALRH